MKVLMRICLALLLITTGCKQSKVSTAKFSSLEDLVYDYNLIQDKTISWNEILSQTNEKYSVYVYSPTCGHCNEIKETVIQKALEKDDFYFVLYTKEIPICGDPKEKIGSGEITDICIVGTPSLLVIENGILIDNIGGKNAILLAL